MELEDVTSLLFYGSVDIHAKLDEPLLRNGALMKWTYDPSVDALLIEFLPNRRSARTDEAGRGILLDYDKSGHPISLEILDASGHFPGRVLRELPLPAEMIPLSEASRRAGLDPATLRQQIHRKRLRATKHRREWWVDPAALSAYLANRAPQGRRSNRIPARPGTR